MKKEMFSEITKVNPNDINEKTVSQTFQKMVQEIVKELDYYQADFKEKISTTSCEGVDDILRQSEDVSSLLESLSKEGRTPDQQLATLRRLKEVLGNLRTKINQIRPCVAKSSNSVMIAHENYQKKIHEIYRSLDKTLNIFEKFKQHISINDMFNDNGDINKKYREYAESMKSAINQYVIKYGVGQVSLGIIAIILSKILFTKKIKPKVKIGCKRYTWFILDTECQHMLLKKDFKTLLLFSFLVSVGVFFISQSIIAFVNAYFAHKKLSDLKKRYGI